MPRKPPLKPVVLEAPSVGDIWGEMLRTARTVAQTTHEPVRVLWLFPSHLARERAAVYLREHYERRSELLIETPPSTGLGIYMRYVGPLGDPSENKGA